MLHVNYSTILHVRTWNVAILHVAYTIWHIKNLHITIIQVTIWKITVLNITNWHITILQPNTLQSGMLHSCTFQCYTLQSGMLQSYNFQYYTLQSGMLQSYTIQSYTLQSNTLQHYFWHTYLDVDELVVVIDVQPWRAVGEPCIKAVIPLHGGALWVTGMLHVLGLSKHWTSHKNIPSPQYKQCEFLCVIIGK